jgi:hypothetical protein
LLYATRTARTASLLRATFAASVIESGTLFKKKSTAFHKAILPTFTKQLRKNYTKVCSHYDKSGAKIFKNDYNTKTS